jgi:hypothetical protein
MPKRSGKKAQGDVFPPPQLRRVPDAAFAGGDKILKIHTIDSWNDKSYHYI